MHQSPNILRIAALSLAMTFAAVGCSTSQVATKDAAMMDELGDNPMVIIDYGPAGQAPQQTTAQAAASLDELGDNPMVTLDYGQTETPADPKVYIEMPYDNPMQLP